MAFVDSIKRFVFPTIEEDDEDTASAKEEKKERSSSSYQSSFGSSYTEEAAAPGIKKAKVVSINAGSMQKIVVVKLDAYAGAKAIIDHLKAKTPVVFNIARLDRSVAVRVVDSIYGSSYALDGSMQKVSNDIFIVAPHGMEITGDITEQIKGSNEFSWDL